MAFGVLENGLSVGRITSERMDRQKSGEMLLFSLLFVSSFLILDSSHLNNVLSNLVPAAVIAA